MMSASAYYMRASHQFIIPRRGLLSHFSGARISHRVLSTESNGTGTAEGHRDEQQAETATYSASAKIWADAAREESEEAEAAERSTRMAEQLTQQHENWTGEESVRDAVLRMLVDKYKPLRGPAVRSADEKLKTKPPIIASSSAPTMMSPITRAVGNEPILQPVEGHKPWLVTFKPPSHAVNVKVGNFASSSSSSSSAKRRPLPFEESDKSERSAKKRSEQAERLGRAKESTLDYRMGIKVGAQANKSKDGVQRRPIPVNLKGWATLVEERIERARQEGHFETIRGRGRPLARETDEHNPFIAREEFLMNRIVQRNGAAPPWVELQTELEAAVSSFRAVLQESWTRRAIRMLTLSRSPTTLAALRPSLEDVRALRDSEWEKRERAYHDAAVEEVNSLVRRYNGVAPYPVRRAYHERQTELDRAYWESGEAILRGIEQRVKEAPKFGVLASGRTGHRHGDEEGDSAGGQDGSGRPNGRWRVDTGRVGLWATIKSWFMTSP